MSKAFVPFFWCLAATIMIAGCAQSDSTDEIDIPTSSDSDTDTDSDSDTDGDSDTDSDTDTDSDSDTDTDTDTGTGYVEVPTWLIHISDDKLWHIDIDSAVASEVCDLIPEESVTLPSFQSVTFSRVDDRLLAGSSSDNSLWEVFLPSCEIVKLGHYSESSLSIPGICPYKTGNDLYGISTGKDALYRIYTDDEDKVEGKVKVELLGPLGLNFGNVGGTWVEGTNKLYSITNLPNANGKDGLMLLETDDLQKLGTATLQFELTEDFGSVGMEHHPHNGLIYACTNPGAGGGHDSAPLYRVNIEKQSVELVGLTGLPGNCDNLGAPWGNPVLPPF